MQPPDLHNTDSCRHGVLSYLTAIARCKVEVSNRSAVLNVKGIHTAQGKTGEVPSRKSVHPTLCLIMIPC
jgi:hypothetical protein